MDSHQANIFPSSNLNTSIPPTEDQLIEVFATIAELNDTAICKDWVELIGAVGVEGMLRISNLLGGKTFRVPTLYEVLTVYAALMTLEIARTEPLEIAKQQVIGGLVLHGFDELVQKIADITDSSATE